MALACGASSPRELLPRLRPHELGNWAAMWRIDPWGEERGDLRIAVLTSLMANVNRDSKKRSQPFKPRDFLIYRDHEADEIDDQRKLAKAFAALFNVGDPKYSKPPEAAIRLRKQMKRKKT